MTKRVLRERSYSGCLAHTYLVHTKEATGTGRVWPIVEGSGSTSLRCLQRLRQVRGAQPRKNCLPLRARPAQPSPASQLGETRPGRNRRKTGRHAIPATASGCGKSHHFLATLCEVPRRTLFSAANSANPKYPAGDIRAASFASVLRSCSSLFALALFPA